MNEAAIFQATTKDEIAAARELFEEYAAWLGVDLCFQNFQRELDTLPGAYAPPCGRLLLARMNDALAGCVALRPLEDAVAEMKRLYVRPAFRGTGLGRNLVRHMIEKARQIGYRALRLDTLRRMEAANHLYGSFGFQEIAPYNDGKLEGIRFLELKL
jgi:GNAT superfamily N-acetyltransferase